MRLLRTTILSLLLLLVSSPLSAAEYTVQIAPEHPSQAYIQEKQYLEKVEQKWAKVFHIDQWNVKIYPVSTEVLWAACQVPCMAGSYWDVETQTGIILIMQRSDYTKDMKKELHKNHLNVKGDQRNSVLHEILHNVIRHMREELAVQTLTNLIRP